VALAAADIWRAASSDRAVGTPQSDFRVGLGVERRHYYEMPTCVIAADIS
jgi:hypothetical protein